MQRLRKKPKWVTGLRPRLETLFSERAIGGGGTVGRSRNDKRRHGGGYPAQVLRRAG